MVIKVTPQALGPSIKTVVNVITLYDEHFEDQAIALKKLFYKYNARRLVIDANGLGIGLIDYMVKPQVDPDTGETIPPFGIYNDKDLEYKKYKTADTHEDAIYIIKANAPINTAAHTAIQSDLNAGKIKFLIDERTAKNKLEGTKVGQAMSFDQRAEYLKPFTLTSILFEEMMNLREDNEGVNIILKRASRGIGKDKFSALEYGVYYIKEEEENKKKKKKFNVKDFMLMN